jgi:hypothetical protein
MANYVTQTLPTGTRQPGTDGSEIGPGCKDQTAINYNRLASRPCTFCCRYNKTEVAGCMDTLALNYDRLATVSRNELCLYPRPEEPERPWTEPRVPLTRGCTDSRALNYDPSADIDCRDCCVYQEPQTPETPTEPQTPETPTEPQTPEPQRPQTPTVFCPKINEGDVDIISDYVTTDSGTEYITYANGVDETCCSNKSLNSNMPGEWVWDGSRCVLNTKVDSTKNTETTTITINETPILMDGCEDVVITTYVYFSEPGNKCFGGQPIGNGYTSQTAQNTDSYYNNPPITATDISVFSNNIWSEDITPEQYGLPKPQQTKNCCYDVETPISGRLIIQNTETNETITDGVTYVNTYTSTQPSITDFNSVNGGFNRWIKLTTTVNVGSLEQFNLAVEFTDGLFKCCEYDIYFDDISVNCDKTLTRELLSTDKCPGFELRRVIDNKKSWVYNPGTEDTSNSVYDNIIRSYGDNGLIQGHGDINRTFAPSADAELNYRDTNYYGFHNVMEKHSNLVLNSKEVVLQFNMCADYDCDINPQFLIDDDGGYILDDDGGRIIVGSSAPMPNLLQLEQFKKTFQGFWIQFMEQFIPATTIFVAGEKWCNPIVCEEKVVCDYMMDVSLTDGVLSPSPITLNVTETENLTDSNTNTTPTPVTLQSGDAGGTNSTGVSVTTYDAPIGQPITVGNISLYTMDILDPDLGVQVLTRNLYE